jgi:hypothetical protein
MTKNDGKGGTKVERKKTIVTTAKAKKQQEHQAEPPHRRSKYVGVSWNNQKKKWQAMLMIDGKRKRLGFSQDQKEAARIYDEQAALLSEPVNFPLHDGMEQAVKRAPKRRDRSKVPNVNRPSKYVGVTWDKNEKVWRATIRINGKSKTLGLYHDEKEAAHMYDKQAALLGRSVNFPLHEGMEQAVKGRKDRSTVPNVNRPSKYVGVTWGKMKKKWDTKIMINGKSKSLGYYDDEKEAARMYDEQAALLGKPVNFPLHDGMEQAVKRAPKGSGRNQTSRAKS